MEEPTDAYIAHNWGKVIPGSENPGPEKYDNHERVRLVNNRLCQLGLTTWFDAERMSGNDGQIKQQMTKGLDKTQVFVAFITKEYERKVNTYVTNEYCYFELGYAAMWITSPRMIAVVMEHEMMMRKWTGCLGGELGNHLRIDISGAFEKLEKYNDSTDFDEVCQTIYHQIKGIADKGINPIRNPETDRYELISPAEYNWIKAPFFDTEISEQNHDLVNQRLSEISGKLSRVPIINRYLKDVDFKDIIVRILQRSEKRILFSRDQTDAKVLIFNNFFLLLEVAQASLVNKVLSATIQVLKDERTYSLFEPLLVQSKLMITLFNLITKKSDPKKLFENKREEFRYLYCAFTISFYLLHAEREEELLESGLYELSVENSSNKFQISKSCMDEIYSTALDSGLDNFSLWKDMEKGELDFVLEGIRSNLNAIRLVCNAFRALEIIGKNEENKGLLEELGVSSLVHKVLLCYFSIREEESELLYSAVFHTMTILATHLEIAVKMKSHEYLLTLVKLFLKFQNVEKVSEPLAECLMELRISPDVMNRPKDFDERQMNFLSECLVCLFIDQDVSRLYHYVQALLDIHQDVMSKATVESADFAQFLISFEIEKGFSFLLKRLATCSYFLESMNGKHFQLLCLIYRFIIDSSSSSSDVFNIFSAAHLVSSGGNHSKKVALDLEHYQRLIVQFSDSFLQHSFLIDQWERDNLDFFLTGCTLYSKSHPNFLLAACKTFQILFSHEENAKTCSELNFIEEILSSIEFYRKDEQQFPLVIQLLTTFELFISKANIRLESVIAGYEKITSLLIDVVLFQNKSNNDAIGIMSSLMVRLLKSLNYITDEGGPSLDPEVVCMPTASSIMLDYLRILEVLLKFNVHEKSAAFDQERLITTLKLLFSNNIKDPDVSLKVLQLIDFLISETELVNLDDLSNKMFLKAILSSFNNVLSARISQSAQEDVHRKNTIEMELQFLQLLTMVPGNVDILVKLDGVQLLLKSFLCIYPLKNTSSDNFSLRILGLLNRFLCQSNGIKSFCQKDNVVNLLSTMNDLESPISPALRSGVFHTLFVIVDHCDLLDLKTAKLIYQAFQSYLSRFPTELETFAVPIFKLTEFVIVSMYSQTGKDQQEKNTLHDTRQIIEEHKSLLEKNMMLSENSLFVCLKTFEHLLNSVADFHHAWQMTSFPLFVFQLLSMHYPRRKLTHQLLSLVKTTFSLSKPEDIQSICKQTKCLDILYMALAVHSDQTFDLEVIEIILEIIIHLCDIPDLRLKLTESKFNFRLKAFMETSQANQCDITRLQTHISNLSSIMIIGRGDKIDLNSLKFHLSIGLDINSCNPTLTKVVGKCKATNVSIHDLKLSGFLVQHLKIPSGYSLSEIMSAGYKVQECKEANIPITEMKAAGYTLVELTGANGYSVAECKAVGVTVPDLKAANVSPADMKAAGYTVGELIVIGGYSISECKAAGFIVPDFKVANISIVDMKAAGYTVTELKVVGGYSISECKAAQFPVSQMKKANISAVDMKAAGYTVAELKVVDGYSLAECKTASFSVPDFKAVNIPIAEMKAAGYTVGELKVVGGYSVSECKGAGYSVAQFKAANISIADMKAAGYTMGELKVVDGYSLAECKTVSFSVPDFKAVNIPIAEMKAAGYTVGELKVVGGYSVSECKGVGFPVPQFKKANIPATDMKAAGYTVGELKVVGGYSVAECKAAGYSVAQFKAGNVSAAEMKAAIYTVAELKVVGGYLLAECKEAGFPVPQFKTANISIQNMKTAGYLVSELLVVGGYSFAECEGAGYTVQQFKAANIPLSALKAALRYTVSEVTVQNGYTIFQCIEAGYTVPELKAAGTPIEEMKAAGYTVQELEVLGGYTLADCKLAGYSVAQFKAASIPAREMKALGYTVAELKVVDGYSGKECRAAGYSVAQFRTAGVSEAEMKAAGFTLTDLRYF